MTRQPGSLHPLLVIVALGSCLGVMGACSSDRDHDPPASVPLGAPPYEMLSSWGLFVGDLAALEPAPEVWPYEVAAPLWSDGALKRRFVVLPEGERATYHDNKPWSFPEGTIVIKHFAFPASELTGGERHVETRLMVREDGDWTPHVYLWNDTQSDARRHVPGKRVPIRFEDSSGEMVNLDYVVPNTDQCGSCHEQDDTNELLGLISRQVRRAVSRDGEIVDQLSWLAQRGLFDLVPEESSVLALADPYDDHADPNWRARSWLHANCSHCHRPSGGGGKTGLVLEADQPPSTKLGLCKSPVAAGSGAGDRPYDIVPGQPELSIMMYRITSTEPEVKMPELPNRRVDKAGADLIEAWIRGMDPTGCNGT